MGGGTLLYAGGAAAGPPLGEATTIGAEKTVGQCDGGEGSSNFRLSEREGNWSLSAFRGGGPKRGRFGETLDLDAAAAWAATM